eukprot:8341485-Pyramimonas_sp.AAC.1
MGHRIWVDDLAQRVVGSRAQVRQQLISSLKETCQGLASMKLRAASKSIVTCSHHPDAVKVARALRLAGFTSALS